MVQKLGHELCKHLAGLQPGAVLGEAGRIPDRIVRRKPHEPAAQKIVVQLLHQLAFRAECRRTPAAAMRSAIALEGSRVVPRWRKASQGDGSAHSKHLGPEHGSSSADDSEAPVPPARCTKTTRLDPQKRPACEPPTIHDTYIESSTEGLCEAFCSKLLESYQNWSRRARLAQRHLSNWERSDRFSDPGEGLWPNDR